MTRSRVTVAVVLACAALSLGSACASQPPPTPRESASASEAAVRRARDLGADQLPEAAAHLELAQDHLERAMRLLDDGEQRKAEWLMARSVADAELAAALAREAQVKAAADEAAARVREGGGHSSAGPM